MNVCSSDVAHFDAFRDQWWDRDGELRTLHQINPIRLEYIISRTKALPTNSRLLDVGCGGGILSEPLAQHGFQVDAIDVNQSAIDVATAHARLSGVQVAYHCTTLESYQSNAHSFAVITCMEMLEHVPDPLAIITHCARLLAPGGMLFVATLNRTARAFMHAIVGAEYILGLLPKGTHQYQRFIKPSELAVMGESAGLTAISSLGISYNPVTQAFYAVRDIRVNYILLLQKSSATGATA